MHGGDLITYKNMYGGEIIDFSSNINPLGPPKGLKDVLDEAYFELSAYPDIHYRELKSNIADYLGCRPDEVIAGNGALEIISNMCIMFKRVVVFIPCFIEYIKRPEVFGRQVLKLPLKDDFTTDESLLEKNLMEGDLLILGNPNNPTGRRIPKDTLVNIYETVERKGGFLLLDEAFFEFCPYDYDSIKLLEKRERVCIIRAATKFFALPGIRLGYAYANPVFIKSYREIESPWSINSFANAAARCIFKDADYIKSTKDYINKERQYMLNQLSKIEYVKACESHANFILVKILKHDEDHVFHEFIRKGIMIRKASTFEGLDKSHIRMAVKDHENNVKIINCIRECF